MIAHPARGKAARLRADRANTIMEMQRQADWLRSLPDERPGRGPLEGQILTRPDAWIADLDAAIASLKANEWPAPGSPLEKTLLAWISQNNRYSEFPGQDAAGSALYIRRANAAKRILEAE